VKCKSSKVHFVYADELDENAVRQFANSDHKKVKIYSTLDAKICIFGHSPVLTFKRIILRKLFFSKA